MRAEAILREAWRNVVSGTARSVILTLVVGGLVLGALTAEAVAISRLEDSAVEFRTAGGSTLTLVANGRVDGARCDALAELPGVHEAGAIKMRTQQVVARALPDAPIPEALISPGFPAVLGAETDSGTGILLPRDTAATLGLDVGDTFTAASGTTRIAGVYEYPRDGRRNGYGYLAMSVTDQEITFDECWIEAWPQSTDLKALLFTTLQQGTGDEKEVPSVHQLNASLGVEFDGDSQYHNRITRFGAPAVALLALVCAMVSIRTRRVELAAALHDGLRRSDLWSIVLLESAFWVVPLVVAGMAYSMTFFGAGGDLSVGVVLGGRLVLAGSLSGLAGVCIALALTREKDLFAYSKDR